MEVVDEVLKYPAHYVCLTGGEPLVWGKEMEELVWLLLTRSKHVTIETGGGIDISNFDRRTARYVLDIKCPSSGMQNLCKLSNIQHLKLGDEMKFVIANWKDFDYAERVLVQNADFDEYFFKSSADKRIIAWLRAMGITVLFSPVFKELHPGKLADWILESGLPVRMQVQMHKTLWPEKTRGY